MINRFSLYSGLFCAILFYVSANESLGQQIKITNVELNKGKVMVNYDLIDDDPTRKYTLRLYSSKDNYIQPLAMVSGDIGVDQGTGANKQVVWKANKELDQGFDGNISLEIKGTIYVPFITLEPIEDYGTLKRGKTYQALWSGGREDNVLNFELYRGDQKEATFEERPNIGNTNLIIPRDVKPGGDYFLKISDSKNRDEVVFSGRFEVERKYPLPLQIGVGAVLGGAIGFVLKKFLIPDIKLPPLPDGQ